MNGVGKPTLDQARARHAYGVVQGEKGNRDNKKFGTQAKKLPTRIRSAGLGQSLAFLVGKGYAPGLVTALNSWVLKERLRITNRENLLDAIIHGDADLLRRATDETLAYLQWLTRFAEAEGLMDGEDE